MLCVDLVGSRRI